MHRKNLVTFRKSSNIWKFQITRALFTFQTFIWNFCLRKNINEFFANWWSFHFTFLKQSSTCCAISSGVRCNRPWHTGHDWHCELRMCSGYSDSESPLRLRVFARKRPWRFVRIRWNVYNLEKKGFLFSVCNQLQFPEIFLISSLFTAHKFISEFSYKVF